MTEHKYIAGLHRTVRLIAPQLYVWKINDNFQGGVADAYYSGDSDHWIEYKYIKSIPKRPTTPIRLDLSLLQQQWLRDRHAQGRKVAVIAGSPAGSVLFEGISWDRNIITAEFLKRTVDKDAIVNYILTAAYPKLN